MEKSALLVMDVQRGVVDRLGDMTAYLERLASAIEAARHAKIPVIYVVVQFRLGYPEAHPRNKITAELVSWGKFVQGGEECDVHPAVAAAPGDVIITKTRVSAFSGTDLDLLLRSMGIENLVLAGLSTSRVVLSTVCQAFDLDYNITVLEDLCQDQKLEVHQILVEEVFSQQGKVLTGAEWAKEVRGGHKTSEEK